MAAPADRWVSESRLRELLAREGEAHDLDYKAILDIQNDPRHRLKLVKLTAAMTGLGGDIAIGVDPRGVPTGQISAALAQVCDERTCGRSFSGTCRRNCAPIARPMSSTARA